MCISMSDLRWLPKPSYMEKKRGSNVYRWFCSSPKVSKKTRFFKEKVGFSSVFDASTQCKPKKHLFWKKWKPENFLAPLLEISTWKKSWILLFSVFFSWKIQSVFKGKSMNLIFKIIVFVTISIHKSDVFKFFFFRKGTFALKRDAKKICFFVFKKILIRKLL